MPVARIARIPHPLRDRFALGDLPKIAPWVAQEISYAGTDTIRHRLAECGYDADGPQLMATWIAALAPSRAPVWAAA